MHHILQPVKFATEITRDYLFPVSQIEPMHVAFSRLKIPDTFPLRHKVLSQGQSIDEVGRPGDEKAIHFGAIIDNVIVGIISLYPQNQKEEFDEYTWRIRGMAIDPDYQSQGIGSELLKFGETFLSSNYELREIWCNARKNAMGFYKKLGYVIIDEVQITFPYDGISYRMNKLFPSQK